MMQIKAGIIDSSQPINAYRIVYTKNGKKPLVKITKNSLRNNFIRFKTQLFKLRFLRF
jgi:hypothetical protein